MGISTDGVISFGVVFEEGQEFPWDNFDGIDEWWMKTKGYKPVLQPFTKEGRYAEGWTEDDLRFKEYFAHRDEWRTKNPLPVEEENYCNQEFPMTAIVIPALGHRCSRGFPAEFDPAQLIAPPEKVDALVAFLKEFGLDSGSEPGWILTSYWG